MATIKRQQRAYRRRRLSRFRSLQLPVSLCNIRARCLIDHALLQGGAICLTIVQLSYPWDSVTWLDYRDFLFIYFSSRIAHELRLVSRHITLSRWVNAKVVVCEWTWIQEEREKLSRSSVCLSYSSRIPHSFAPLWGLYDWLHTRVFVRFCWTTSFLRELRWEFSFCSQLSPNHWIRIFLFFFFLCCVLCELCFTLCNRENDCESRITVEFELWIRKRGKMKIP